MALKALIFGGDDIFSELKPYYTEAVRHKTFEIVAYGEPKDGGILFASLDNKPMGLDDLLAIDMAIISSHKNFYERMKLLEANNIPRNKIVDGRVFQVPDLDVPRLLSEGVAYGTFSSPFKDMSTCIYPRVYSDDTMTVKLDAKSYIAQASIMGFGELSVGKFCAIADDVFFQVIRTKDHNYRHVTSYALERVDWSVPMEYYPPQGRCQILIGNDVWIGRGVIIRHFKTQKPLIIGDGAVIAADSVVVKDVPPYAIVGGNPAQVIKYRFPPHVIEALLRIKWWDWSLDKIHDNFKYFNDIEKFISLHDN